jgi:hypothetical protein
MTLLLVKNTLKSGIGRNFPILTQSQQGIVIARTCRILRSLFGITESLKKAGQPHSAIRLRSLSRSFHFIRYHVFCIGIVTLNTKLNNDALMPNNPARSEVIIPP